MCYTCAVHKSFYASGFLYNRRAQQILLLKSKEPVDTITYWSTFGADGNDGEEAKLTFQRAINEMLGIDIKLKDIYPVYEYFCEEIDKVNCVFYAEVRNLDISDSVGENMLSWVSFGEIVRFSFLARNKQDIIVGERVINLKQRIADNLQPLAV